MTESNHQFRLLAEELAYIKPILANDKQLSDVSMQAKNPSDDKITIELTPAQAEKLRDHLTHRLAVGGFEEDYSLSKEGHMLEQLIDKFYVP